MKKIKQKVKNFFCIIYYNIILLISLLFIAFCTLAMILLTPVFKILDIIEKVLKSKLKEKEEKK